MCTAQKRVVERRRRRRVAFPIECYLGDTVKSCITVTLIQGGALCMFHKDIDLTYTADPTGPVFSI